MITYKTITENDVYMQIYNGVTEVLPTVTIKTTITTTKGKKKYVKVYLNDEDVTKEFCKVIGFNYKKQGIEFINQRDDEVLIEGLKAMYEAKIDSILKQEYMKELDSIKDENPHGDLF